MPYGSEWMMYLLLSAFDAGLSSWGGHAGLIHLIALQRGSTTGRES